MPRIQLNKNQLKWADRLMEIGHPIGPMIASSCTKFQYHTVVFRVEGRSDLLSFSKQRALSGGGHSGDKYTPLRSGFWWLNQSQDDFKILNEKKAAQLWEMSGQTHSKSHRIRQMVHRPGCPNFLMCPRACACNPDLDTETALLWVLSSYIDDPDSKEAFALLNVLRYHDLPLVMEISSLPKAHENELPMLPKTLPRRRS